MIRLWPSQNSKIVSGRAREERERMSPYPLPSNSNAILHGTDFSINDRQLQEYVDEDLDSFVGQSSANVSEYDPSDLDLDLESMSPAYSSDGNTSGDSDHMILESISDNYDEGAVSAVTDYSNWNNTDECQSNINHQEIQSQW